MDKMLQSIEDLKNRQADFEKALEQKEAEKLMIYQVEILCIHILASLSTYILGNDFLRK